MEMEQNFSPFDPKKQLSPRLDSESKCDSTALLASESNFLKDREQLYKDGDFSNRSIHDNIEEKSNNFMDEKSEGMHKEVLENNCKRENGLYACFPDYPSHGVIGTSEPLPVNLFYNTTNTKPSNGKDFKKQKFDFYEMYEKHLNTESGIIKSATPLPGLGYLCRGFNTANIYKVDPSLPVRFRTPDLLRGYGCEKQEHPLFRTTSSEYGKFGPTVHDVPHKYHGLKIAFTGHLSSTGMPKNRSLNIK